MRGITTGEARFRRSEARQCLAETVPDPSTNVEGPSTMLAVMGKASRQRRRQHGAASRPVESPGSPGVEGLDRGALARRGERVAVDGSTLVQVPRAPVLDAADALLEVARLDRAARAAVARRDEAVAAARASGCSWTALGSVLGISPQAVQQREARR